MDAKENKVATRVLEVELEETWIMDKYKGGTCCIDDLQ